MQRMQRQNQPKPELERKGGGAKEKIRLQVVPGQAGGGSFL